MYNAFYSTFNASTAAFFISSGVSKSGSPSVKSNKFSVWLANHTFLLLAMLSILILLLIIAAYPFFLYVFCMFCIIFLTIYFENSTNISNSQYFFCFLCHNFIIILFCFYSENHTYCIDLYFFSAILYLPAIFLIHFFSFLQKGVLYGHLQITY